MLRTTCSCHANTSAAGSGNRVIVVVAHQNGSAAIITHTNDTKIDTRTRVAWNGASPSMVVPRGPAHPRLGVEKSGA